MKKICEATEVRSMIGPFESLTLNSLSYEFSQLPAL